MALGVPVQRTWNVNDVVTAAMMNSNVRDAVNFLSAPPVFVGTSTVAQSFASGGAATAVTLNNNVIDTYSGHSVTTNNADYFASVAGYYFVSGGIAWATTAAAGARQFYITVNGNSTTPLAYVGPAIGTASYFQQMSASGVVYLNVADYVQMQAGQNSGAALSTVATITTLSLVWMHA